MEELDILKDILQYRIANQLSYNQNMIVARNPEVRSILTQLRDDEMRDIVMLQQKVERYKGAIGIISKIFPKKPNY